MKEVKNKAFQIKCEKYAEYVIGLLTEESKTTLLRAFVTALIITRVARSEAGKKDFEGWISEFAGAHDMLAEIAELAGIVVNCTGIGKDGKGNFELVIPEDEEEGGAI